MVKTVKISSENVVIGEIPRICRNNIYHDREEIFRDYEITKGKMDDVFLAVTGKKLIGGEEK